jgi:uncharacterized protein YebE (UPF0316 family)
METDFFNSDFFTYGIMPVLIFLARICDQSLGTMRIIFVSKGRKHLVPILGFFEVLIWITAISKIMQNLDNYVNYIAYAAGFATGNYVGMLIEEKLAIGIQMIRVFATNRGNELVQLLNNEGFGATCLEAHGARNKTELIYTIVKRHEIERVLSLITSFNPDIFYTIEDLKVASHGIFNPARQNSFTNFADILRNWRKGK